MKPTEKQIHIYCSDEVHDKLKKLADANERTMSRQMQVLINQAFAEFSKNELKR